MKISKYTFLFEIDNSEFYIFSTLFNSLVEIDKDSYQFLLEAKKSQKNITPSEIDNEIYDLLVSDKFATVNDIDSFLFHKSFLTTQRADKTQMHLTIAPTMDCCFNCHYCFEKYKKKGYMSETVMDSIIKYLNSLDSKPELNLTWFGGEPLMALKQMKQFYEKLIAGYKKPVTSNIITSGFHINENAVKVMQNIGVQQIQITLDGLKDTHNTIKFTPNCTDSFSKVLDNAEILLSKSDIEIIFRVNLTKQNAHEYIELYNYLMNRFKHFEKKVITPAFVMDRGTCDLTSEHKNLFFSPNETAQFILELYNKHGIHSPHFNYPSNFCNECAIRNVMSLSFDPKGYAYKCWEMIGNKEYTIG